MADDPLVFDLQRNAERIQIGLEAIVVLVLYDRGDNAGRRCSEKRLGVRATRFLERSAEIAAFGLDRGRVGVGDGADRLWQHCPIGHGIFTDRALLEICLVPIGYLSRSACIGREPLPPSPVSR